ncbi:M20 family metallopeptidase [Serpentinicella sp. ANB-PHB4]|uniref:M20 metallopeptidase family protein n=1 Tax=Serpentinicella sp. ANB-PHB4 TaxID=3074076 RepID=UPI0028629743|nr:M20 family metallopeptidase [Serpentinicella sp. ANB-PHB4]MDR5659481.1 M20 family metallopeptidase [Serpentinicella sp. ANB-PHB4]
MVDVEILWEAKKISNWVKEVRRDFHKNPELGLEEFRTQEKIISYLEEMQIPYRTIANTGLMGIIKGHGAGRTVALRADMDALPIEDKKNVSYQSRLKGKMHACGHDAHLAILLGAAKILKSKDMYLKGDIKLLFQPAEETVGGAKPMIEEGALVDPQVDVVLGLHVSPEINTGCIAVKYGQMNAASDTLTITIYGKSAHGAHPDLGADAIVIAGQVLSTLQTVVSRGADPRRSAVITIGKILGGDQNNIIANKVEMIGTMRTLDQKTRERLVKQVKEIVESVPKAMGGKGELIREEGYAPLVNHNNIVKLIENNGRNLLGENKVRVNELPSYGVEDFGYFIENTPGAFFQLGCRNEKKGIIHDLHNDLFDIDEDCLATGVAMQIANVISLLNN